MRHRGSATVHAAGVHSHRVAVDTRDARFRDQSASVHFAKTDIMQVMRTNSGVLRCTIGLNNVLNFAFIRYVIIRMKY